MNSFPNAVGLVIGFLFLGAIMWIIRWLGVALPPSRAAGDRRPAGPASECILVPLMELKNVRATVELACQLASEHGARILLVHVIEFPYTVDLNAPFSEAEEQARHLLSVGEQIVRQHGLPVETRVLRHRTAEQAVSELAREVGAQTIVLATGKPSWWSFGRFDHMVAAVMRGAPCRVVVTEQSLSV